ncbi:deoxyguanosinetriphosphate triphosphohydrolase family protein [Adhaeribacter rhizoryzae]|uniref:Deoxyguanosinetriphosphate triphosphohydrolase-like protein n=1 Tax=Adhaeribacter rhizoryzae TaxID=2607907 RepID=A0A5M6DFB8_9BACT|nr:dNTP triphosphohydrolase [Adhaeribacter rhizoryzae]KAA5545080.1 dNTP triphosphohydrolase [Adhaeribacter rhizoryzae]
MKKLYNIISDCDREIPTINDTAYRNDFRRDYARLIHSSSFRRLQGKTQLFPGVESDFFRNRLTHSIEVAQIAKTIALKLNEDEFFKNVGKIDTELIEFAALAHDLGHPPFGHNGEEALNELMFDSGGYEGNAQTLRILTKIEKKAFKGNKHHFDYNGNIDNRCGLNLCYRTLAAILKHDKEIPESLGENPFVHKGYYHHDKELVKRIKHNVTGRPGFSDNFRTIECYIMDIADDIAYSTYDLEDAFKAKFLTPLDLLGAKAESLKRVAAKVSRNMEKEGVSTIYSEVDISIIIQDLFYELLAYTPEDIVSKFNTEFTSVSDDELNPRRVAEFASHFASTSYMMALDAAQDGYLRTQLTSTLVNRFIEGVDFEPNEDIPALSKVYLKKQTREEVEVLKNFTFTSQIESSRLKIAEVRGKEIVKTIFDALYKDDRGYQLMPDDYQFVFSRIPSADLYRKRIICDFIAGMTDRYAIEFYGRLKSENPQTIFKPF